MKREQLMNELRNRGVKREDDEVQLYIPTERELLFIYSGCDYNLKETNVNMSGVRYDGCIEYTRFLWQDGDEDLSEQDCGMYMYIKNKYDNKYGELINRVFDTLCFIYGHEFVAADLFEVMVLSRRVKEKSKLRKTNSISKPVYAAFIQKPLDEGITGTEIMSLVAKLSDNDSVILLEIQAENATAMGVISVAAAEMLDFDYSNLETYVKEVLNDTEKETEDGYYKFDGFPVYIGY